MRRVRALLGRRAAGPAMVNAAASGVSAVTTLVVAQGVGAAAFGRFTVVLTIALIVNVGMLMSQHFVMYQELPRADPDRHPGLVTTALLSTLALGALLFAAGTLAAAPLTALLGIDARTLLYALALALALTVNYLAESFLRGLERFALTAGLKLAVAAGYLGLSLYCMLVLGVRDVHVYLALLIAANTLFAVVAVTGFPVAPRAWSAALARSLYRHGAYLTALAAVTALLFGVDVIFLNHWASPVDVGHYSVYNNFPKRLLGVLFTDGVGLVLMPVLARMDKPAALRRVARVSPAVFAATAVVALAAGPPFFLLAGEQYPYATGLMALSAAGIGMHSVFNLYAITLSMDGVRGAKALIVAHLAAAPVALGCQALLIARHGLAGGLTAFALTNLVLVAAVVVVTARVYGSPRKAL